MFPEMELENWKNILVFKIIAFQSGSSSSHIVEQDSFCNFPKFNIVSRNGPKKMRKSS